MTTIHSFVYMIYSMNPDELAKFMKYISQYIKGLSQIAHCATKIHLYEDCITISTCYDTVCSGQAGKERSIREHVKNIQEKILPDYPSFAVEFYFAHWHLNGLDKKGLFLGKDCFLHKMAAGLFPFNNEGKKCLRLIECFGEGQSNSWILPEGEYLPTYIKKHGTVQMYNIMPHPPDVKVPNFEKCEIEDD